MEAKLIKVENTFYLKQGGTILGTSSSPNLSASIRYSLSLKNCEAIERGYDLDELAIGYFKQIHMGFGIIEAYKKGFQEALEVNADKRFTLKEMVDCWNRALEFQTHKETLGEYIKSLQQTEWDVIVEMEGPLVYPANLPKEGEERPDYRPKLSENGCIILKRK